MIFLLKRMYLLNQTLYFDYFWLTQLMHLVVALHQYFIFDLYINTQVQMAAFS